MGQVGTKTGLQGVTLSPEFRAHFPKLEPTGFQVTSRPTAIYNCIAWAAGDTGRWWWPVPAQASYWPEDAPREETVSAFVSAFATRGYEECATGDLEPGFEKVALFANGLGKPTHAARQLEDGSWTSKLGRNLDLSHAVNGLDGPQYGSVVKFLRRPRENGSGG